MSGSLFLYFFVLFCFVLFSLHFQEYADLLMKKEDRLGRNACTLLFQGFETVNFKGLFQAWEEPVGFFSKN